MKVQPTLEGTAFAHPAVQVIEHAALGTAPQGCDKKLPRAVPGYPVDHKIRAQMFQTADDKVEVSVP